MSQALYRKWRPHLFDEVVGQEHITRTLKNSVAAGRVGHAYLFCGPRGTGKTTSARLLAKAVNCLDPDPAKRPCNQCAICQAVNDGRFLDLIEIDAASNTGVDDIRDLRDKINFSPSLGRFKVYVIDECHMLSTAAFNALLKTLEEPPPHAMFILATTEEHKVPVTIKSRCQQFNFRLLTTPEIVRRLQWMSQQEGFAIEPAALTMIAQQGAGSLRDAESLLDQLLVAPGDTVTLERAQMVLGTATDTAVIALTDAWLNRDGATGLHIIHQALGSGTDARQFCRQMVMYLRDLLLWQAGGQELAFDGTAEQKNSIFAQAQRAPRQSLIEAVKRFNEAALTPVGSWQPQLPLELAFIELLPAVAVPQIAQPVAPPVTAVPQPPPTTISPPLPKTAEPPPPAEEKPVKQKVEVEKETAVPAAVSLQSVSALWREMLTRIGQRNKNLPALLNMGKPLAVEGSTIVLGFDFPIFKEKFDKTAGASQVIGEVYSELLNAKCTVRSVATSEYAISISKEEFSDLAQELGGVVSEE